MKSMICKSTRKQEKFVDASKAKFQHVREPHLLTVILVLEKKCVIKSFHTFFCALLMIEQRHFQINLPNVNINLMK